MVQSNVRTSPPARVIAAAPGDVAVILDDVNQDGRTDFLDISSFIASLSTGEYQAEADVDENGSVNFLDISPFLSLIHI